MIWVLLTRLTSPRYRWRRCFRRSSVCSSSSRWRWWRSSREARCRCPASRKRRRRTCVGLRVLSRQISSFRFLSPSRKFVSFWSQLQLFRFKSFWILSGVFVSFLLRRRNEWQAQIYKSSWKKEKKPKTWNLRNCFVMQQSVTASLVRKTKLKEWT